MVVDVRGTSMNERDEKRFSDIENAVKKLTEGASDLAREFGVLVSRFKDCRDMQNERQDRTNEVLGELKAGQDNLVQWHIKNLQAVNKARFTFISIAIAAIGAAAAVVALIMKFAR